MDVATVHLVTETGTDPHPILFQARALLENGYGISPTPPSKANPTPTSAAP